MSVLPTKGVGVSVIVLVFVGGRVFVDVLVGPVAHGLALDELLRADGVNTWKSDALSSVSRQPPDLRKAAVIKPVAPVGPVPS